MAAVDTLLGPDQLRWILQGAVTITVASADAQGQPSIAQAIGCRVVQAGESQRLRLLMLEPRNRRTVADLRAGRAVATVFTHSASTRSLQLKADGAVEQPATPADTDCVNAYIGSVVADWALHGVAEAFVHALLPRGPGPLLAFEFQAHTAFDQTPGLRAGTQLVQP